MGLLLVVSRSCPTSPLAQDDFRIRTFFEDLGVRQRVDFSAGRFCLIDKLIAFHGNRTHEKRDERLQFLPQRARMCAVFQSTE